MSSFRYLAIFGSILHIFNALLFLLDRPKAYPRSDRKTPVLSPKLCSVGFVYPGTDAYLTQVPGTGMEVLQNSQKFRVGSRML